MFLSVISPTANRRRREAQAGVPNPLSYPPSPFRESTVVSVALGGRSLPVVCRGAGGGGAARAHCWRLSWMLAQAASVASRYAFGADGVGAARPGACGEADRRLALRARRSALRAQRRLPICVLHTRAPSASSACKGCSWCSARGAQLRRSAGRSARTRASARTPACRSAGTGHRAVQLCVRCGAPVQRGGPRVRGPIARFRS